MSKRSSRRFLAVAGIALAVGSAAAAGADATERAPLQTSHAPRMGSPTSPGSGNRSAAPTTDSNRIRRRRRVRRRRRGRRKR